MHSKQIGGRMFMCFVIATMLAMALVEPFGGALNAYSSPGITAGISAGALAVLVLLAFFDTLINDILPCKYSIRISMYQRQLIWMFIACILVGLAYVHVRYSGDMWAGWWLTLFGGRCVSIAFLELRYEITVTREKHYARHHSRAAATFANAVADHGGSSSRFS